MTNGNDLIEFEENYIGYLEEDFIMKYIEDFQDFCCKDENIIMKYKELNKDKWDEFVMDAFNNNINRCD